MALYIVILGLITFVAARNKSEDDYLRASGNIGWGALGISLFASLFSSYNLVVNLTLSYLFGPWIVVVYLGVFLSFVAMYYLVKGQNIEIVRNKRFNSIVDYFIDKFGNRTASALNILLLFILISLQFFINTTVFNNIIGWGKYETSIVVGLIVLTYTYLAGLKVEILTDVFQGILMILIVGLVFMIDTSQISSQTVSDVLTDKTIIISAFSIGIAQFLSILVQPDVWQKVYAAKSMNHLKKGLGISFVLLMIVLVPMILIGLTVRSIGIDDPGNIFYSILNTAAPGWFMPFLSVALFAAFMSSLDSLLFAISSQFSKYGFWIKSNDQPYLNDDKKLVKRTRITIVVVILLTLITSLFFSNFLVGVMQLVSLLTVISVVVLFSIITKSIETEVFYGSIAALVIYLVAVFTGMITDVAYTTLYPSAGVIIYLALQKLVVNIRARNKA
jgi:Na+/proline symporter